MKTTLNIFNLPTLRVRPSAAHSSVEFSRLEKMSADLVAHRAQDIIDNLT